jgi:hypothetical protein
MSRIESGTPTDAPAIAAFLASQITSIDRDEDDAWYWNVEIMLSNQSKETLEFLIAESSEFNQYHWGALDNTLSDFIYGGPVADSSFGKDEPDIPEEFLLRLAFGIAQLVVEEHLPMLSAPPSLSWSGDYDEFDVEEMNQLISNAINYLAVEMVLEESDLRLARGVHLCKTFTNYEESKLPDETLLWMSENAMVILAHALKVFSDKFDFELAKEIVRVQTPLLREGVL